MLPQIFVKKLHKFLMFYVVSFSHVCRGFDSVVRLGLTGIDPVIKKKIKKIKRQTKKNGLASFL